MCKSLNDHCKEHNHELFYFLAKEITRQQSSFLQIQKSMIAGLETCSGVIQYPYMVAAMSGDHTLFMFELCKVFGTSLTYNRSSDYFKDMYLKSLK